MRIIRTSQLTGNTTYWDMPITQEQLDEWAEGVLIQEAMPHLTADQREFILTGITPSEWNAAFNELDETYEDHYVQYKLYILDTLVKVYITYTYTNKH